MSAQVECVWAAGAELGECPCWDQRSRRLFWVDIKRAELHALQLPEGTRQSWQLPDRVCSLDSPSAGWDPPKSLPGLPFVACGDMGLAWLGVENGAVAIVPIAHPERDRLENRFNDGKMGPDGRYWAGTMHDPEELATGSLYAFSADGGHAVLDRGYHVSNGPAFSPDGSVVYHADSMLGEVYAFDLAADGTLVGKRVFARFAEGEGHPDGMTTDRDGNLWIAIWDGARLERLAPDGARLEPVPIPTRRPTSCTFLEPDCSEMFVTSASVGLPAEDALAGGLFCVRQGCLMPPWR